jgi:hypothetical protein
MSVKKETTIKGIWEAFQKQHVDKGLTNKIFLGRKFFMFQMNPFKLMEHHLNKFGAMVDELDTIEATILEVVKVMVLLMSLLDNYQTLITSLESSKVKDRKWQNVNIRLFNERLVKKEKTETSQVGGEITLVAKPKVG